MFGAQPDEVLLRGQGMLPQAEPQFLGHLDEVHVNDIPVGGVRRHHLAVPQTLGRVDLCLHRRGFFSPAHLPDVPARVAEALAEHVDGQSCHVSDQRLNHLLHRLWGFVPVGLAARDVEKRLIDREYLHVRGDIQQRVYDAGRDRRIALGPGGHPDETGAEFPGLLQPHGGMDAERPGLIRAGDDAGAGLAVGDADGFAAEFGVVELLNGGKECVHIHEGDEARPVVVGVRLGTIDPSLVDQRRSRGVNLPSNE